jgi:hypothetical protein
MRSSAEAEARRRGRGGRLVLALALLRAAPSYAYRPFVSTDAAVAAPKTVELELGYFGLARTAGHEGYSSPQAVISFGARERFEAVGEFVVQHPQDGRSQVVDAAVDVKGVAREGVLQDKPGPSVALESSLLFPDSGDGNPKAGFEQTFVLSHRLCGATLNWNLGGGFERSASLLFGTWGLIAETPDLGGVRAVGELNGTDVRYGTPDNSGLLGAIWDTGWKDLSLDGGYRRGLSAAAADWAVTAGITIAFRP